MRGARDASTDRSGGRVVDALRRRVGPVRPQVAGGLRHVADLVADGRAGVGRRDVGPADGGQAGGGLAGGGRAAATEADLAACYRLLLGRAPDDGGWTGYLPYIHQRPTPVDELVGFFLSSVEFRRRLATTFGWTAGGPEAVDLRAGYRIWMRPNDPSMAVVSQDRDYEPHVSERMLPLLAPGAVMVDVGASFGFFTVLAGRAVGPTGRVVACEPGPQNQSVLLLNVTTNLLDNVEIHPVAVGAAPGALLYSQSGANGAVSAYDGNPAQLGANDLVPTRPLDDILGERTRVDVIKIDVEGAEGLVLAGAGETLRRHRPALFVEFSPPGLAATSRVEARAMLADLAALGYRFEVLGLGHDQGRTWSPDDLVGLYAAAGRDHLDLLATADRG
jgi:FkbM family methyltransferase